AESTTRPVATRPRAAVVLEEVERRTPATGTRTALHNGTRPNRSAAKTETTSVKSNTVRSGLRPVSIPDQEASIFVAEIAKSHPSVAPAPTSNKLSHNNWRKM